MKRAEWDESQELVAAIGVAAVGTAVLFFGTAWPTLAWTLHGDPTSSASVTPSAAASDGLPTAPAATPARCARSRRTGT